jgi:hypothetical protein
VTDSDAALRRGERGGMLACLVMAVAAWGLARGRAGPPLGVLGGGLLVAISYRGIKGGVDTLVGAVSGRPKTGTRVAIGLVKFFTRYAILAAAAYVIMARLRLPPLAVFAGASSFVVAVAIEAVRGVVSRQR